MSLAPTLPAPATSDTRGPYKVAVVIPTCNAMHFAAAQIAALQSQSLAPDRMLIIDSESSDGSAGLFRKAGFEVYPTSRAGFDHGGTRNRALVLAPEADIVIYLTQDAIPRGEHALEALVNSFDDPSVAIAYGRQRPREEAGAIERHAREFNYPGVSCTRSSQSIPALGIKCIFNSNSFSAYRRTALESIGRFPERVIMGEDQVAAARLILAGWSIAYAADAEVTHSHGYSLLEEFRRYFDIGVFHQQNRELLKPFAATSAGLKLVRSELSYLFRSAPWRIPEACVRTGLKLAGYQLGKREAELPHRLKLALAMHDAYFLQSERALPAGGGTVPLRAPQSPRQS